MPNTTPTYGLPYLEPLDPPDIAGGLEALAEAVEGQVARLDAAAPGVMGSTPIGTSADVTTTEVITDTVTFVAEAGRAYRVSVMTPVLDNQATAGQTAIVTIRYASGPSVTNADALVGKAVNTVPGATASSTPGSAAETVTMVAFINNPPAGQLTVGVGLAASSASSNVRFLASGTTGPNANGVFVVEDVGAAY